MWLTSHKYGTQNLTAQWVKEHSNNLESVAQSQGEDKLQPPDVLMSDR